MDTLNRVNTKLVVILAFSLLLPTAYAAEEKAMTSEKKMGQILGVVQKEVPAWFKESFLDFREDATEAGESNKHLLLFFDLTGCPYCAQLMKDNFVEGDSKTFIQEHFDNIHVNIKGDREIVFDENTELTEKDLAEALGVRQTPTVLFMNADNQVVMRVDGYRSPREFRQVLNFVKDKAYKNTDFVAYRNKNLKDNIYTLKDHKQFTSITDFKQALEDSDKKPLAVLFEDGTCDACGQLHNETLALDKTAELMKQFNFVRLDGLSEEEIIGIDGKKTTPKQWLNSLGISYRPALLLFSEGKEIERVTGLLKSFHYQQLLSYVANRKYHDYPKWTKYGEEYSKPILESGQNIDIWK